VSPILLRPIREQFEHDRIVRLLQNRYRRRHAVSINAGAEESTPVRLRGKLFHPDLVLMSLDKGHRLHAVVEVETTESVNSLEAMAQWATFGRVRADFYLFVPAGAADIARRLCEDNDVAVTEIWTYHAVGQQMRFAMAYRAAAPTKARTPSRPSKPVSRKPAAGKRRRAKTTPGKKSRSIKSRSRS
jgi:hypothetical protein